MFQQNLHNYVFQKINDANDKFDFFLLCTRYLKKET